MGMGKQIIVTSLIAALLVSGVPAKANTGEGRTGEVKIEARTGNPVTSMRKALQTKPWGKLPYSERLVILRFSGPVQEEWTEQVTDLGVKLGDYLPDYSFIAQLPADKSNVKKIKDLPFVSGVEKFHPSYKVSPEVMEALKKEDKVTVQVSAFSSKARAEKAVRRAGGNANDEIQTTLLAEVDRKELEKLIQSDDVLYVAPVAKMARHNNVAAVLTGSAELQQTGYTGKNQIVSVIDSGLDTGKLDTIHPDFRGQLQKLVAVGRPNNASDIDGHGTHVAGSIVGNGSMSEGEVKGMAPGAKLVFYSDSDEKGNISPKADIYKLWKDAYKNGARINSYSAGVSGSHGAYLQGAQLVDQFLWENRDAVTLIAAGNEGDEYEDEFMTVTSPATAKNAITVGASESYRPQVGEGADDPDTVAHFSSRGPTRDGRIKPDVVAPGTYILSTRSILAPEDHYRGIVGAYGIMSGTSMATPITAGGVAQIREYLQKQGVKNPSGALLKSLLISGADDLGDSVMRMGFGRVNLVNSIESTFVDQQEGLQTGGYVTYQVEVNEVDKPFNATLVWTDYPASLLASRTLVNDLNMVVITPSEEVYNGNDMFEAPYDDEVDNLNNVEQVYIPRPEKGMYTVVIKGYNVPKGPQPFAFSTNGKVKPNLIDEAKIQAAATLSKSTIKLSLKGKADKSVKQVRMEIPGFPSSSVTAKNGSFSYSKSVSIFDGGVDFVKVTAVDDKGNEDVAYVSTELDLMNDDSVELAETDQEGSQLFSVRGNLSGSAASVWAVAGGKMHPMKVANGAFSGTFTVKEDLDHIQIVAADKKGYYEIVHFVKSGETSKARYKPVESLYKR